MTRYFQGPKGTAKLLVGAASMLCLLAKLCAQPPVPQTGVPTKEEEPLHYGPLDMTYNIRGSVVYDDNIFISPEKEDDVIWTATPMIGLGLGDYRAQEENLLSIDYMPSFILFTDHSDNNAIDQEVYFNGQWRPGRMTLRLRQAFQDFSGAVIDVGGRVNRRIYTTDLLAHYELSPKTDFELEGRQVISDYERLLDYNDWLIRTWVDYKITPLVKLGGGISAGWVDISDSVNQSYQQALVRGTYSVTELVDVRASAGAEVRQYQGPQDSRVDGVFTLGGTYTPREGTIVNVDGYRRPNASVVLLNNNYIATGISAGVRQTILESYAIHGSIGYENADYVATHPTADASREDNYIFGRLGVDWQALEQLTVGLWYQYRKNDSTTSRFDFNNHQVAMNFYLTF